MTALLGVPDHALTEWEQLHATIIRTGPTPCAGPDRDDWTGGPRAQARAADACLDCPAMTVCAAYAAAADEPHGTWGGLTTTSRHPKRKKATR